MRFKSIVTGILFFSLFLSLNAQENTMRTWWVADAKIGCQVGDAMTSCLRIKDSANGDYRNFPWDIEGFSHEKGFEYVIEVTQEPLKYTEADGPQFKWTLNRIISQTSTIFTDKRLLANNTFNLLNIEQYGRMTLCTRAKPSIRFDIDSNRIYGFAGCNSFSAPCNYATAFMEFGPLNNRPDTCKFSGIEDKILKSLMGRATFYVRKGMLFVQCENFMNLHLKPEKSLDSILRVIEEEKLPKNDINYMKNEDGTYRVSAPATNGINLFFIYRPMKLKPEEYKTIKYKLVPVGVNPEVSMILILSKTHEKPDMHYALITYKNGTKKEVEIRDDTN